MPKLALKYNCRLCAGRRGFPTISKLRIHQWSAHRDTYRNVSGKRAEPEAEEPTPTKDLIPRHTLTIVKPEQHEPTAQELLDHLMERQSYMNGIISFIADALEELKKSPA